ncbi:MAG: Na+/H+ antiporter NhaC family protein [Elainellaceae cyanobacterium]
MDVIVALSASSILLFISVQQGYFIGYPLFASLALLLIVLRRQGMPFSVLLKMAVLRSQKAGSVLQILLLIGMVISVWMASGTVPALVFYGVQAIHPQFFILSAFALTSLVSIVLGTSFGTVGTIGIALMIVANAGGVHPHWAAGAIIAGAYVGDRCSPMSSSANLIASITQTDVYANLKNMAKTSVLPLALSGMIYFLLSLINPAHAIQSTLTNDIQQSFDIQGWVLVPAGVILGLALVRVEVKRSMIASLLVGGAIALVIQDYSIAEVIRFAVFGFELPDASPLQPIFVGGGVRSMVPVCVVVILSTAIAGVLSGTRVLVQLETYLSRSSSPSRRFLNTALVGTLSAIVGCSQTIAILLTQQLAESTYRKTEQGHDQLALDLENTVVVIAPLIPWNIAGFVPAAVLMTDAGFIPFAIYLYLLPLLTLISLIWSDPSQTSLCNSLPKKKINS